MSVTLHNLSNKKAWFPTRHYKVFLHQPPATQYDLQDAAWKGQMETVEGQAMGQSPRYVALGAGEEAEFSLVFRVPENADRKALFLVVLDAPPIALGN